MIFILHYILFCGSLPPVLVYIAIYLRLYSGASMTEIGTLLMILPFISVVIRPLFCGLADRNQGHKRYLMGALALMALGYGSLSVAPFFPEFVQRHGRLVWYADVVSVLTGAGAFAVVWSLGDALAVNGAQMAGVNWGTWKLWALVSFAVSGTLCSQLNELSFAPHYVPALFLLVILLSTEIVLLALWPNRYFVMYGSLKKVEEEGDAEKPPKSITIIAGSKQEKQQQVVVAGNGKELTKAPSCQVSLLKFIAMRDRVFIGYMLMLTSLGFAINCHVLYYYMQIEQLCKRNAGQPHFSTMSMGLILSNCISEIIALLLLPRLAARLGRATIVTSCIGGYFLFQLYHAIFLTQVPLYWAIAAEILQGCVSGVVYTLINEVAIEVVERLDDYLPELIDKKIVPQNAQIIELKSSLRATMQGLLSGALDGLGNGLGAIVGGIFLDHFSFTSLWSLCATISFCAMTVHALVQWRAQKRGRIETLV